MSTENRKSWPKLVGRLEGNVVHEIMTASKEKDSNFFGALDLELKCVKNESFRVSSKRTDISLTFRYLNP